MVQDASPPEISAGSVSSDDSASEAVGPAGSDWKVGEVILDLYEITDELGEGGMGKVWKVHHRGWDVDLAVKTPRPEIVNRAGGVDNFIAEAENWANLPMHSHIVSCYYVRLIGEVPRIFAEYVNSGSLEDWIRQNRLYEGSFEDILKRIVDIAIQFAWGLDFAHEQGLIHQDVKPANVMINSEGTVKVTDFGLSRAKPVPVDLHPEQAARMTIMANKQGMTPAYASPEQSAGGLLTRRTDLYSWAVSILEMFAGKVIWPVGTVAPAIMETYLEEGPGREDIPPMPPDLADVLRICFRENPDQRYQSMDEAAGELIRIYERINNQAYPRSKPKAGKDRAATLNNRASHRRYKNALNLAV